MEHQIVKHTCNQSLRKRNRMKEIMTCAIPWMDLEIILLSEVSHQEHRTQGCLRAGTGRQPWWVWGERPGPAGEREARRAEQPGTGADVGYPSSPPASVPGSPSPPPKEGCFHRVVAGSCTWIPEVPGNRLELGWPGVSMAQARTRPHSPRE